MRCAVTARGDSKRPRLGLLRKEHIAAELCQKAALPSAGSFRIKDEVTKLSNSATVRLGHSERSGVSVAGRPQGGPWRLRSQRVANAWSG